MLQTERGGYWAAVVGHQLDCSVGQVVRGREAVGREDSVGTLTTL